MKTIAPGMPACLAVLMAGIYGNLHASEVAQEPGTGVPLKAAQALQAAPAPTAPASLPPPELAVVSLRASVVLAGAAPLPPVQSAPTALPTRGANAATVATAPPGAVPRRGEFLLLDVVVNDRVLPDVARAEASASGELLLSEDAWRDARFIAVAARALADGTRAFALEALPEARYRLDRGRLRLEVVAGPGAFVPTVIGLDAQSGAARRPEPGLMLNYDAAVTHQHHATEGGALLELIAFGSRGNLSQSVVASSVDERRTVRLDTTWRYDRPETLDTLVLGDTIGSGGAWSRPVRYGGVRWSRNFALRPGFITFPQLSLRGEAALPSAVDVLVNESSRVNERVQPGPFSINNVPVVTGAGEVSLVVRDLLGREQVVTQNYYASPQILAAGLVDFSLEAGFLRDGWGERSRYRDWFGAATVRRGLTSALTGEGRVEIQAARRAAGVEVASLLGAYAVGRIALARSAHDADARRAAEQGAHWLASLERSTRTGGAFVRYERAGAGFAPFGEADDASSRDLRVREQVQLGGSRVLGASVSFGASLIRQVRWNGDDFRLAAGTLSMLAFGRGSLSLSATRRIDGRNGWELMAMLGFPLDSGVFTGAQATRRAGGALEASVLAARTPPLDTGVGWRAEAFTQKAQRARAAVQYNTPGVESTLEVAAADGAASSRAGLRGAIGVMNEVPFATRFVTDNSFAVVDAQGVEGLPIYLSNQVVGRTGPDGRAFVPNLLPWQANRLQVLPEDLPVDVQAEPATLQQSIVPHARGGHFVRFPMRRVRQALVVLQGADGAPVPQGEKVHAGGHDYVAGRRGEVWLADLPAGDHVRLAWGEGRCARDLVLPAGGATPATIGPLACVKE